VTIKLKVWKIPLADQAPVQPLIVNTPGSALAYGFFLCRLAVPVLLCHSFNSCASSSLGYGPILMKLQRLQVLDWEIALLVWSH
jgi:hypothetical protein